MRTNRFPVLLPLLASGGLLLSGLGAASVWLDRSLVMSTSPGGGVSAPELTGLLALASGVLMCVIAGLLAVLPPRPAPLPVSAAAAETPLLVSRSRDEIAFLWGRARTPSQRRGTPRPAITR
ncbi:MAG: hypothetical protein Q4E05_02485 [Pseudoclavibacter sp.]|nr:hypothetical protein [Pseudoclavibacter sp.]